MAQSIRLVDPLAIQPNPENPRLVFRGSELQELQESIENQGILVPLTVYETSRGLFILDGERRWRCATRLGLTHVPVIVQPEPTRLQNIMMMFAIHHQRREWDPLPTAYKLRDLEEEFTERQGRRPREWELAQIASMSRGEVRRLKKLLALPAEYHEELLGELEKPRGKQKITVDHVLEVTKAASSIHNRGVIEADEEDDLRKALLDKFRSEVETNTVEPRKLARIARAVERQEISAASARHVVRRLIEDPSYTIEAAFRGSVEQADFEHSTEQLVRRVTERLEELQNRGFDRSSNITPALRRLRAALRALLGD